MTVRRPLGLEKSFFPSFNFDSPLPARPKEIQRPSEKIVHFRPPKLFLTQSPLQYADISGITFFIGAVVALASCSSSTEEIDMGQLGLYCSPPRPIDTRGEAANLVLNETGEVLAMDIQREGRWDTYLFDATSGETIDRMSASLAKAFNFGAALSADGGLAVFNSCEEDEGSFSGCSIVRWDREDFLDDLSQGEGMRPILSPDGGRVLFNRYEFSDDQTEYLAYEVSIDADGNAQPPRRLDTASATAWPNTVYQNTGGGYDVLLTSRSGEIAGLFARDGNAATDVYLFRDGEGPILWSRTLSGETRETGSGDGFALRAQGLQELSGYVYSRPICSDTSLSQEACAKDPLSWSAWGVGLLWGTTEDSTGALGSIDGTLETPILYYPGTLPPLQPQIAGSVIAWTNPSENASNLSPETVIPEETCLAFRESTETYYCLGAENKNFAISADGTTIGFYNEAENQVFVSHCEFGVVQP